MSRSIENHRLKLEVTHFTSDESYQIDASTNEKDGKPQRMTLTPEQAVFAGIAILELRYPDIDFVIQQYIGKTITKTPTTTPAEQQDNDPRFEDFLGVLINLGEQGPANGEPIANEEPKVDQAKHEIVDHLIDHIDQIFIGSLWAELTSQQKDQARSFLANLATPNLRGDQQK